MASDLERQVFADGVSVKTFEMVPEKLAFLVEEPSGFVDFSPLVAVNNVSLRPFQDVDDIAVDVAAAAEDGFAFVWLVILESE